MVIFLIGRHVTSKNPVTFSLSLFLPLFFSKQMLNITCNCELNKYFFSFGFLK